LNRNFIAHNDYPDHQKKQNLRDFKKAKHPKNTKSSNKVECDQTFKAKGLITAKHKTKQHQSTRNNSFPQYLFLLYSN
jgi:hypothetical protein